MNLSSQSSATIKASLEEALKKYMGNDTQTVITDIYIQPKPETGELVVLNDDEEVLAHAVVAGWEHMQDSRFYPEVETSLRNILAELQQAGKMDSLNLVKPYSFVLVDEEKETVAELLLVDDLETMFLSDELLKGLDEELNAFLKDLLEK